MFLKNENYMIEEQNSWFLDNIMSYKIDKNW